MRLLLLLLALTAATALHAQTPGQSSIPKKNVGAGSTYEHVLLSPSQLLGRTSTGTLSGITLGTGLTLTGTTLTASGGGSYQPLNPNLTSISALTPQAYGLGLLEIADNVGLINALDIGPGSGRTLQISSLIASASVSAVYLSGSSLKTTGMIEFQHDDETLDTNYTRILPPPGGTPAVDLNLPLTSGRLLVDASALDGAKLTDSTVTNQKLANSSISINGSLTSLGTSVDTRDIRNSGDIIRMTSARESAAVSGTTTLPVFTSTTVRPMTEGTLGLTLTVWPRHANNRIRLTVCVHLGCSVSSHLAVILGRSGDANARATAQHGSTAARIDYANTIVLHFDEVAGTIIPITYHVRFGGNVAATYWLNRAGAGAYPAGLVSTIDAVEYVP